MSCTESMVPFNSCRSKQVDSQGTGTDCWEDATPRLHACPSCPHALPPSKPAVGKGQTPPARLPLCPQASPLTSRLSPALSLTHLEFLPLDTHPEAAPASSTGAASSAPAHAPAQLPPDALNRVSLCKGIEDAVSSSSLCLAPAVKRINRNTNSPLRRKPNACTHTHTNTCLHIYTGTHTEAHTYAYRHAYAHTHAHTCIYMHVLIHPRSYTGTHAYTYVHACAHIHIHACTCSHSCSRTQHFTPGRLHNVSWSLRALPTEAPPSPDTHLSQVLSETQEWVLMR